MVQRILFPLFLALMLGGPLAWGADIIPISLQGEILDANYSKKMAWYNFSYLADYGNAVATHGTLLPPDLYNHFTSSNPPSLLGCASTSSPTCVCNSYMGELGFEYNSLDGGC